MKTRTPPDQTRRWAAWLPLLLGLLAAGGVSQLRAGRDYEVAKPSENIRATPEGRQIGTLVEGATIEEVGRDGRWVKFRLEAWIWGPSLEGYAAEPAAEATVQAAPPGVDAADTARRPRAALSAHLDEVRALVDAEYGRFYGMRRDADLGQVQVRLRVNDLEREALERRQMRLQHALVDILDEVEFGSLRIETNRPDGSGEVGAEMAVTAVADIRRIGAEDLAAWRRVTRRTSDGGATWTGPEVGQPPAGDGEPD